MDCVNSGMPGINYEWINPDLALLPDTLYTRSNMGVGRASDRLLTYFGPVSLPSGALIRGIDVRVLRWGDSPYITDIETQLLINNAYVGQNKGLGSWSAPSLETRLYGGSTDLWGLTHNDIFPYIGQNSGLGVSIRASSVLYNGGAYIDYIYGNIYYDVYNTNLFVSGAYNTVSGTVGLSMPYPSININQFPLHAHGPQTNSGQFLLYTEGTGSNKILNLTVSGVGLGSGNLNLVLYNLPNQTLDLFVMGSSLPHSTVFNLFLQHGNIVGIHETSGNINLISNGIASNLTSYTNSLNLILDAIQPRASSFPFNLFLPNSQTFVEYGLPLNLTINGRPFSIYNSLSLSIAQSGLFNSKTLHVKGKGFTIYSDDDSDPDGWYPYADSMNLFIRRDEVSTLPLFLRCIDNVSSGIISWYEQGHLTCNSGINLTISNTIDSGNKTMNIHECGF